MKSYVILQQETYIEENADSEHDATENDSKYINDSQSENKNEERDVNENFSSKKETLRIPSALTYSHFKLYGDSKSISNKQSTYNPIDLDSEELQEQLKQEIETRKFVERNIELMKESMNNELEKERQVRYSLQQKLKEAHDALHNFSCKMLASKQCDECTFKDENGSS
ncbi:hypothetical protein KUTeg_017937 [Tegillarca granosa]|uniref:Uncharacterized protein n=1 Tax=Tegillarca granosa TaxID=220873 RepID=A0ABQ9EGE2_TEGGR|nr:hypothetical protein KUTeg_017937 [Tegillarca granosa]